jgi:hypothetical protein
MEAASMGAPVSVKLVTASEPTVMEAFTTMESSVAMEALVPAEFTTAAPFAFATKFIPATESVMIPVPPTVIEAMKPRADTDKYAANKIIRTVVAIRRAYVWGIAIVAIRADRSRHDIGRFSVAWPNPNSDPKPDLRVGNLCPCHNHEKSKQNSVL